jgi:hypothetical protein
MLPFLSCRHHLSGCSWVMATCRSSRIWARCYPQPCQPSFRKYLSFVGHHTYEFNQVQQFIIEGRFNASMPLSAPTLRRLEGSWPSNPSYQPWRLLISKYSSMRPPYPRSRSHIYNSPISLAGSCVATIPANPARKKYPSAQC